MMLRLTLVCVFALLSHCSFVDLWSKLHKDDPGYTEDTDIKYSTSYASP